MAALFVPGKEAQTLAMKMGEISFIDKWDKKYFSRLKSFVSEAGRRGIVVEMTFFSSLYRDEGWKSSPLNGKNNVNKIDSIAKINVQTLDNGKLLKYQESMVRKIVAELKGFDNVFYEIQMSLGHIISCRKRKFNGFGLWCTFRINFC